MLNQKGEGAKSSRGQPVVTWRETKYIPHTDVEGNDHLVAGDTVAGCRAGLFWLCATPAYLHHAAVGPRKDPLGDIDHRRINYTRDDPALGLGYFVNEKILVYVEPSWAWSLGNENRQKRWAAEGGIQYQGPRNMWNNSTAFYAAAHVRAFAETSWDPGVSVQTGFHVKRDQRSANLRLGLEGYVGRAVLGEFALDYDEAYLTGGIFFDFY